MGKYDLLLREMFPNLLLDDHFDFATHTTIGISSRALCAYPQNVTELIELIKFCRTCRLPYFILGGGSNVLPPDEGYGGLVISTRYFDRILTCGELVMAESGVTVAKLLRFCLERGLGGVEFLTGIPATVGGLVYMNGGTARGHIGDVVESVCALVNGKTLNFTKEECDFKYKHSLFMRGNIVVLSVKLRLNRADNVRDNMKNILRERAKLPKGKSMGCVFKNPQEGLSAGSLIEESGCKGWREGDAIVAEEHANFIVNLGHGTAQQIKTLKERVKLQVFMQTGILLEEEIIEL